MIGPRFLPVRRQLASPAADETAMITPPLGEELTAETDDGVGLAVVTYGDAAADTALVFAHGFSMSSADRRLSAVAQAVARPGRRVYSFDFRGHGRSGGSSTLGDREVLDLDAVIRVARGRGHARVVVVGASMGGFVALRHAGLVGGEDAVVTVSAPATWGVARRLRARALVKAVNSGFGRRVLSARGTRVHHPLPDEPPRSPSELAADIRMPVAVVHGDHDPYVPVGDALQLYDALGGPKWLTVLSGFGHAEAAYSPAFATVLDGLVETVLDAVSPTTG